MKPKTAILLVVLLGACFVYVLAVHTDLLRSTKRQQAQATPEYIFEPRPGDAVKVTITPADGPKMVFERVGNDWLIRQPFQAKAEPWKIEVVTRPFEHAKVLRTFGPNDPDYVPDNRTGLDPPRWTITLVDEADKTYTLEVGDRGPLSRVETYVRPAGQGRTYVVKYDLAANLSDPPEAYRYEALLRANRDQILGLRIEGAETYELRRDQPGTEDWRFVVPVRTKADKRKVENLLGHFSRLRFVKMLSADSDLAAIGLASPRLVVKLWMTDQQPTTAPATQPAEISKTYELAFGNIVGDNVYAKLADTDQVYLIEKSLLMSIQPTLKDLRDPAVMSFSISDVQQVQLSVPSGRATLQRRGQNWLMVAPHPGRADSAVVNTLLSSITVLRADDFRNNVISLAPYGLAEPTATVTLHFKDEEAPRTLLVGSTTSSGEMAFVKDADADFVAVVRATWLEAVLADVANYWDSTILELPDDEQVTGLIVTGGDVEYSLARDADGVWSLSKPLTAQADGRNLQVVLDKLKRVKADKIVSIGPDVPDVSEKYAKATDRLSVKIQTVPPPPATMPTSVPDLPAPATRHYALTVVRVGEKAYAWLEGPNTAAVGEFGGELYDTFSLELRDRTVLAFDPDRIARIRRAAGDDILELEQQADKWVYASDPYVGINPTKVGKYLQAVSTIRADSFVTHAPADEATMGRFGLDEPWFVFELTDEAGRVYRLVASDKGADAIGARYAISSEVAGVFVLPAEALAKLSKSLKDFVIE